jgi:hypothetical protein
VHSQRGYRCGRADQGQRRRGQVEAEFLITAHWPVAIDLDVDLSAVGPSKKPVFCGSRHVGCAALDRDSLGNSTSPITIADGTVVPADSNKETTTLRRTGLVNGTSGSTSIPIASSPVVRSRSRPRRSHQPQVAGHHPICRYVPLDSIGQTVNVANLDGDRDGKTMLGDSPIEPITNLYKEAKP